jgi:hypothetical protein
MIGLFNRTLCKTMVLDELAVAYLTFKPPIILRDG